MNINTNQNVSCEFFKFISLNGRNSEGKVSISLVNDKFYEKLTHSHLFQQETAAKQFYKLY